VFALSDPEVGHLEAILSTIVFSFWKHVEHHWQRICDEIETGVILKDHPQTSDIISVELLAALQKSLNPNKERADQLRSEFKAGFVGIALRVWPGIRTVRMVTTGSFAHNADMLRSVHMRGVQQITTVHAASEGFYGVNTSWNSEEMYTPLVDCGLFEFIPVSQLDEPLPQTFFIDQVCDSNTSAYIYIS